MTNPFHAFWLRPHLLGAVGICCLLALAVPFETVWPRLLTGWCVGASAYVVFTLWHASGRSQESLRREASRLDDSAPVISFFAILAGAASCGAVLMLVLGQKGQSASGIGYVLLAVLTLICTWAFVQVVFAIHYAHVYYGADDSGHGRGGLDFNGDESPDVWDFIYFSVTIGATAQTSDTDITSKRMRHIATAQTVYAYFFNTSLLALAVNMAASIAAH